MTLTHPSTAGDDGQEHYPLVEPSADERNRKSVKRRAKPYVRPDLCKHCRRPIFLDTIDPAVWKHWDPTFDLWDDRYTKDGTPLPITWEQILIPDPEKGVLDITQPRGVHVAELEVDPYKSAARLMTLGKHARPHGHGTHAS